MSSTAADERLDTLQRSPSLRCQNRKARLGQKPALAGRSVASTDFICSALLTVADFRISDGLFSVVVVYKNQQLTTTGLDELYLLESAD